MSLQVSNDFAYVILTAIAMQFQVTAAGFAIGGQRRKHGVKYPDMGNGRFSAKLSDTAWTEFNNYQRVHQNYLENFTAVTTNLFLAGLSMPRAASACGVGYIIARWLYGRGYVTKGPEGRLVGGLLAHLFEFGLVGINIYNALKMLGLV